MSIKNSNETIGNRTRDLPACSAVETHMLRDENILKELFVCLSVSVSQVFIFVLCHNVG